MKRKKKKIICSLTQPVLAVSEVFSGLMQAAVPCSTSYIIAGFPINFQIPFVDNQRSTRCWRNNFPDITRNYISLAIRSSQNERKAGISLLFLHPVALKQWAQFLLLLLAALQQHFEKAAWPPCKLINNLVKQQAQEHSSLCWIFTWVKN